MKVLVTGSNGRIGSNLVRELLARGHSVRGFVYPGDAKRVDRLRQFFPEAETVFGDLRDEAAVREAVRGVDAVYHLAAAFAGPFSHSEYVDINARGTLHLLEALRHSDAGSRRLIYAGTEAVYWRLDRPDRIFERPITPADVSPLKRMPYFLTKWMGEELCATYRVQYGVPTTVLRFATVIEPSEFLNAEGLPGRFLVNAGNPAHRAALGAEAEGAPRLLLGRTPDGRPAKEHFVDIRDLVQALCLMLKREETVGQTYTAGGAALFRAEATIPYLAERYRLPVVDRTLENASCFEFDLGPLEALGYRPAHDFASICDAAEAIRRGEDVGIIPTGERY